MLHFPPFFFIHRQCFFPSFRPLFRSRVGINTCTDYHHQINWVVFVRCAEEEETFVLSLVNKAIFVSFFFFFFHFLSMQSTGMDSLEILRMNPSLVGKLSEESLPRLTRFFEEMENTILSIQDIEKYVNLHIEEIRQQSQGKINRLPGHTAM